MYTGGSQGDHVKALSTRSQADAYTGTQLPTD